MELGKSYAHVFVEIPDARTDENEIPIHLLRGATVFELPAITGDLGTDGESVFVLDGAADGIVRFDAPAG